MAPHKTLPTAMTYPLALVYPCNVPLNRAARFALLNPTPTPFTSSPTLASILRHDVQIRKHVNIDDAGWQLVLKVRQEYNSHTKVTTSFGAFFSANIVHRDYRSHILACACRATAVRLAEVEYSRITTIAPPTIAPSRWSAPVLLSHLY